VAKKEDTKLEPEIVDSDVARITIHAPLSDPTGVHHLPHGTVRRLDDDEGLGIDIKNLNRALLRDQRSRLVSSMGCVSNPGGPGC